MKIITEKQGIYIDRVREGQIVVGLHPKSGPVILRKDGMSEWPRWVWYILTERHNYYSGNDCMTFREALDWAVRNKVEMHVFHNHAEAYRWVADNCRREYERSN